MPVTTSLCGRRDRHLLRWRK